MDEKDSKNVSLRIKMLIVYVLIGLATTLASGVLSYVGAIKGIRTSAPVRARSLADQLAYSFEVFSDESDIFLMQRMVEKSATLEDVQTIFITDQTGVILAHNHSQMIGSTERSPLIAEVINSDQIYEEIVDNTLVLLRPLHGTAYTTTFHDITGVLWIELNFENSIRASIIGVNRIVMGTGVLIFITVAWAYTLTKRNVTDRLLDIDKSIGLVDAGFFDANLLKKTKSFSSEDEITSLATHFNKMVASLDHRIAFEELISSLSVKFATISKEDTHQGIFETLAYISEFVQADRGYIFEFSEDMSLMSNTVEWCAAGITPEIENLQDLPSATLPWWVKELQQDRAVNVSHLDDLPESASTEREILASQNIQSVLVVPMRGDKRLAGFIGFDSVQKQRLWHAEEVRLLRMASDIIANTFIRQKTQAELETQRDFAELIMNTIGQGITVNGIDSAFEYVNPKFAEMIGVPAKNLIGKFLKDHIYFHDQPVFEEASRNRIKKLSTSCEIRLVSAQGKIINTLVTGSPRISDSHVVGSIAVVTDLTEILQAKDALQKNEERMRAFLDAVPDMIFRMDKTGTFLDFKVAEGQKLYAPAKDIIGLSITKLMPPEVVALTQKHIKEALKSQHPQVFTYQLHEEDGTYTYEAHMVTSSTDEIVVVMHDISQYARLEQMKTDFVNRASHELRTPLTTSLLMTSLLDDTLKLNEEEREYWQVLKKQLDRQRNLLEDLLTLGRLESGRYQNELGQIALDAIMEESIQELKPQIQLKELNTFINIQKNIPQISASQEAIQRVFTNILSNAIKFSTKQKNIYINMQEVEDNIQISVRDEGIGIPSEDLPHVANRFFRASNASRYEVQGSGIGLHIVKNTVEGFGGSFKLKSVENEGTEIVLTFPIAKR